MLAHLVLVREIIMKKLSCRLWRRQQYQSFKQWIAICSYKKHGPLYWSYTGPAAYPAGTLDMIIWTAICLCLIGTTIVCFYSNYHILIYIIRITNLYSQCNRSEASCPRDLAKFVDPLPIPSVLAPIGQDNYPIYSISIYLFKNLSWCSFD